MNILNERYLANYIKLYELIIVIILILDQVNSSVTISHHDGPVIYENSTNYDYILSDIRRNKRQNNNNGLNCEIPVNPLHTNYEILGDSVTKYKAGDFVDQYSVLQISCHTGYALSPFKQNTLYCINGAWNQLPSVCIRTCTSLASTETTAVKCSLNSKPLDNCIEPVTGTIALLSCKPLYEELNIHRNPVRLCREGRWDPPISTCYPTCGNKHPRGTTNIIGGKTVTIGDYPWHIGIYNSTTKSLLCGGSIIEKNIILTAAHCLTDYYGKLESAANYVVAAGKFYSNYDDSRDPFAQYSSVLTIHVPDRYTGLTNAFAQDIAIMILSNPFNLSESVQPVCVELNDDYSHLNFLPDSNDGIVTGWGLTTEGGEISAELKELIIPQIPFLQCSAEVPNSFKSYITADKICGGYLNNATSICRGDSGGALVVKNQINNRYFARGIVSTSPASEALTCDSNQYSLFTEVDKHKEFVRDLVALNQIRTALECYMCHTAVSQVTVSNEEHQTEKAKPKKNLKNFHVVCYHALTSLALRGEKLFTADNVNPFLCTHIIYVGGLTTNKATLKAIAENEDIKLGGYAKFTRLKDHNKDLKVMLYLVKDEDSKVNLAIAENRRKLVNNSIVFLRQHNFDGLDFPLDTFLTEKLTDHYYTFIQELREGFERESVETGRPRLLLTIFMFRRDLTNKEWNIPRITEYTDWLNLYPTYDLNKLTVHHDTPLYGVDEISNSQFNDNHTINHYVQAGIATEKLVLGIATSGKTFKLKNPSMTAGAGGILKGEIEGKDGNLAYFQICKNIKDKGWTVVRPYPNAMGPFAYKGNQWVSYDDEYMVKKKAEYVATNKLGGIMFIFIENDDFQGYCTGKKFPLIQAAKEALMNATIEN